MPVHISLIRTGSLILGFSGGGGSTGISAHTHTSAVGNGGNLALDESNISGTLLYSRILIGA